MYKFRAPPPLTDNSRTNTVQIRVSYFVLERSGGIPLVEFNRSSGALWWIGRVLVSPPYGQIHELILSKFVCLIFLNYVKMALGVM